MPVLPGAEEFGLRDVGKDGELSCQGARGEIGGFD